MGCNRKCGCAAEIAAAEARAAKLGSVAFLFTSYVLGAVPVSFYLATCGGHWGWGGQGATQAGAVMPLPFDVQLEGLMFLSSGPGAALTNPVTFNMRNTLGTVAFGVPFVAPPGWGFGSLSDIPQGDLLVKGSDLAIAYDSPIGQPGPINWGLTAIAYGHRV